MVLLPPREVETQNIAHRAADSQRLTAIRSQLSREELELNEWQKKIKEKKETATDDLNGTIFSLNEKIGSLQKEIRKLEKKREMLLKPLDDTKEIITKNLAVASEMLEYLEQRKKEVAASQMLLDQKLSEAAWAEKDIFKKRHALDIKELDMQQRMGNVIQEEIALKKSTESFESNVNEKNVALLIFEGALKRKEVELAARERLVADGNQKIAEDRKRIESQQQTLVNAMQEAKNKGLI